MDLHHGLLRCQDAARNVREHPSALAAAAWHRNTLAARSMDSHHGLPRPLRGYAITLMTTRRFFARPSLVLFGATGFSSP
jgi:hypothetical protein